MSVQAVQLCVDLEYLSFGQPGSQSPDEVSHCRPAVRMDPHVPTHSVEPPDLGPINVDAWSPSLIRAPGLAEFDQTRILVKAFGEGSLESRVSEVAVGQLE
jgi:hypothetical protein